MSNDMDRVETIVRDLIRVSFSEKGMMSLRLELLSIHADTGEHTYQARMQDRTDTFTSTLPFDGMRAVIATRLGRAYVVSHEILLTEIFLNEKTKQSVLLNVLVITPNCWDSSQMALPWTMTVSTTWPRKAQFAVELGGVSVTTKVSVEDTYEADIDFTYLTMPYTFNLTKWRSRGLQNYLQKFHETPRNAAQFGSLAQDGTFIGDLAHKVNCIIQGCFDIMRCLDAILVKQKS